MASTPRVTAYRNLHPNFVDCQSGLRDGWSVLSARDPTAAEKEGDEWVDPSNSELFALGSDRTWGTKLRCALQKHVVPSSRGRKFDLVYHLGFLEFDEAGEPYSLVSLDADGKDVAPDAELTKSSTSTPILTQLDALREHLASGSNYVIVFIHGWRHDARLGDGNVADLRHYAAHAVRFLQRRCELGETALCSMKVTAIYIGWRGARVDEAYAQKLLGKTIGGFFGMITASVTLFDRKPVAEQVAPGAITSIRAIEHTLSKSKANGETKDHPQENRMIIFGHSLGGDMLATGLHDDLIKLVREHRAYNREKKVSDPIPPVLGNLTVLLNPAAEASKWTSIQREVWDKIPFHANATKTIQDVEDGHHFFPDDQRPIIVSVTSALRFPPFGYRTADCEWLALHPDKQAQVFKKAQHGDRNPDYDEATQDLFPTFKLDFRPLSDRAKRFASKIEGREIVGFSCKETGRPSWWRRAIAWPVRKVASWMADFPFQNFNVEESHTIGHVDPPRPADGVLTNLSYSSGAPFGTTHELFGLDRPDRETHNAYSTLADAPLNCEPANHWLSRVRALAPPYGVFWDTDKLTSGTNPLEGMPAARFLHGFSFSGTAAITRANDPFWNVRAYDNALARHDGYRLFSFICAMNELVMDDITESKIQIPNLAVDPTQQTIPSEPKP